ncbi:hypothetical protein H0H93_007994 [Arthromyces matolae]|nr:hypothetical protein H0H93_007994 [Arthromyces matolae]
MPGKRVDTMATLRAECVNLINGGLCMSSCISNVFSSSTSPAEKIVGNQNVVMHYEKYDVNVVERHSVIIRGWPVGLQFRSPAKITTMEDARMLRDALVSGECKWVKLTRQQRDDHMKERHEKLASGETAPKQRKKRADAGIPRGPQKRRQREEDDGEEQREDEIDKENNCPTKKARKAAKVRSQMPPMQRSAEIIDSDDDLD